MRTWIKKYLIYTSILVFLISIFNYVMDPFQHYRRASLYPVVFAKERFLNPGLAKNYEYDSVISGSSLTENFILSNVSDILKFQNPIKLTVYGGLGYEYFMTLNTAFKHKKIKNILFGLDPFSYSGDIKKFTFGENTFPFHLYNDKFIDDYLYLVSLDTVKETLSMFLKSTFYKKDQPPFLFDKMYEWQYLHDQKFGHINWTELWENRNKNFNKSFQLEDYQSENMISSFQHNFLPFIQKYPETKFKIFYPPYSILAYKDMKIKGWLDEFLKFKLYIASLTAEHQNIHLYDFQLAEEITHNLNNYKDLTHYHQKINKWMLLQMRGENYSVTSDNIEGINKRFVNQINSYVISF